MPDSLTNRLIAAGLAPQSAALFAELGVMPDQLQGLTGDGGEAFAEAALFNDLPADYVVYLLEKAEGNPDVAWELWTSEESVDADDQ